MLYWYVEMFLVLFRVIDFVQPLTTHYLRFFSLFSWIWCPYDEYYLKKLGDHHKTTMKNENVKLIAWTSEGETGAEKADKIWDLTTKHGYDLVIGDDQNALAEYLQDDMILEHLVITTPKEANVSPEEMELMVGTYPKGMVQPALVWYAHHGTLVLHWTSQYAPEKGQTGQKGRPEIDSMWEMVMKRKHALDNGNAIMPVHGTMKLCATSEAEISK